MKTCLGTKRYKLTIDGPESADEGRFIDLADQLQHDAFGEGLDSMDIGDAMGAFIKLAEAEEFNEPTQNQHIWAGFGITVTMTTDWDLFEWDKSLPAGPFDHIKPMDIG